MTFWIHDYTVLFKDLQFWPTDDMSASQKLNAVTRMVIVLSLAGFILTQKFNFIWIGLVTLFIIVMYDNSSKTEAFTSKKNKRTNPTKKNPFMNVLLSEINGNPNREKALTYNSKTETKIIEKVKEQLDPRIYKGTNNEIDLEYSMRQFYINPSTTIPNNQEEFSKFCYGGMISSKEGDKDALARQLPRLGGTIG